MGDTCLPGLQGYPVQVEGWTGYTDKAQLATQNDISLQFGPNEVPLKYDTTSGLINIVGTHTFIMGGNQYSVRAIRFAAPKQQGLKNFSGEPLAELTLWGIANPNQVVVAPLAALVIPIHLRPQESPAGDSIVGMLRGDAVKLIRCIPMGEGVDVIRYMTCVETENNSTTKIAVAYWANGAAISQEQRNLLPQSLPPWGVPPIIPSKFLTVFSLTASGKGNRQYIIQDGVLKPYQATVGLGVSTPEFKNGFRLIQNFSQKGASPQELNAYKCIAINRTRDIKNGKLMLNPETGRRFDEELQAADAANLPEKVDVYPPGKLFQTICIIIGIVLGFAVLAGLLVVLSQFMFTRKSADLPPTPEGIEKLATALGDAIGK